MDEKPKEQEREGFLASLKKKLSRRHQENKTFDGSGDIDTFVKESKDSGVIDYDEMEMIGNIIHFSEKDVGDVMTNMANVSAVDGELTIAEVFKRIMEDGFSRYPVYMGDKNEIVGMFHIRDFLKAYADVSERDTRLKESRHEVVQPIESVPDTKKIFNLFKEMQKDKYHMVVVKDEYGQTGGIVTMEDILEEIFGNIWDEHDKADTGIREIVKDKIWYIDGGALLEDVEKALGIVFDTDEIETMSGFVTFKLGHVPDEEDEDFAFVYGGFKFTAKQIADRLIKEIHVKKF